ncbi:hypothetical protein C0989_001135 [Termitomyces sp. Mn162]|nr:hypothetical protein C0989_001135 [Termitomyces sp. Mn162]
MSTNSYLTPFSATTSPQSVNDGLPIVTTDFTTESSPRDHRETQMALQRTSVTLEAAYSRIRRLRRSISEITDSTTSGERQNRPSVDNDIFSGLAPSGVGEPSSTAFPHDDSFVPPTPQLPTVRLPSSSRRLNRDLPPLSTAVLSRDTPSSSSSPTASQAPYSHLARSQLESRLQRQRESLTDDAATFLGRRVAAREAARTSTTNPGRSNSNPFSRFEGYFAQLIANVEREFDHLRQQRSELTRTLSPDTRPTPLSRRTIELRRQLAARSREGSPPVNSFLLPQQDLHRRRLTLPSRSSTISSRSERLSLLSNFSSIQNLPTPVSTGSSRIVLFEEPNSYTDDFSESRSDIVSNEYGTESDTGHMVRTRVNADGEEHVHPISLLEGFDEPLILMGQGARRVAQRGQREVVSQRQRGWARLDPDGNEIPFEQEELERARSEYRLEAQSRNAVTTSTSLVPGDDDGRIPRVRLSYTNMKKSVDSKSPEKGSIGSLEPFHPCPLPIPLEDMIWTPSRKSLRVNRVSKHASFAGR